MINIDKLWTYEPKVNENGQAEMEQVLAGKFVYLPAVRIQFNKYIKTEQIERTAEIQPLTDRINELVSQNEAAGLLLLEELKMRRELEAKIRELELKRHQDCGVIDELVGAKKKALLVAYGAVGSPGYRAVAAIDEIIEILEKKE